MNCKVYKQMNLVQRQKLLKQDGIGNKIITEKRNQNLWNQQIEIAQYVPNKNPNQCGKRWKRIYGHRNRTNQSWKPEEDQKLIKIIFTQTKWRSRLSTILTDSQLYINIYNNFLQ
ncbi:unnamed protein product [Paramecium primaurelia]|uniref:Myb-like domain-containing protein n=1 Tax=Paramecium primaurelia TaxID=5886 RepID=A0A8S1MW02_PARPR|nr:unnamed protein product [Paramecium primaurelia]